MSSPVAQGFHCLFHIQVGNDSRGWLSYAINSPKAAALLWQDFDLWNHDTSIIQPQDVSLGQH